MTETLTSPTSLLMAPARSRFGLPQRAMVFVVEALMYLVVCLLVALVEYFVAGPITDFGVSNFWLGLVIYAGMDGYSWPSSQSFAQRMVGASVRQMNGRPAGAIRTAIRQVTRFGGLYAIPVFVLDFNAGWVALFAVLAAGLCAVAPFGRAPWDFLASTMVVEGVVGGEGTEPGPVRQASDLQLDRGRANRNQRARRLMLGTGLSSVVVSGLIVFYIFTEAFSFVADQEFSWSLLTDIGWFPRRGQFDLSTLFVGSLWVTLISMVVAAPIGIGVAFYLAEYASSKVQRIVKPMIETLASIPSVVLGLFAISFIYPNVLKPVFPGIGIFSLLAAGLGVGVLTVPIVASISEDAMRAVPRELREASYGLGARKVTTALRVVFPAALSGISAAIIVGISRAIGETMVVFIAAGGSGGALFESNPTEPGQTLTAAMASLGAGTDSVAGSGIAFQSLYFLGALLFLVTLLLNVLSDLVVRRFRQVY